MDRKEETVKLYSPLLVEEVKQAIKDAKSEAAGPDGISLKLLKRIPVKEVELLFNMMLYLQYTPKILRTSRTILIPKTKDLTHLLKNYRPISISSIFLRTCNKIISTRLQRIDLNSAQRGFTKIDGCFANNLTLHTIIKTCRERIRPYSIIALDLQKAFDSVSMSSIQRAITRLNVDSRTRNYISSNYEDSSTTIFCDNRNICTIPVRRGVKQGDPMSPFLFNAIIDELLCELKDMTGMTIGNHTIPAMAYEDDLIFFANNTEQANRLLRVCTTFFSKRGLKLNVAKCMSLSTDVVPSKKKLFTRTNSSFTVDGENIRAINTEKILGYLGLKFATDGSTKCTTYALRELLTRLCKAPLKPQQKMTILRLYLIPRFISYYQNPTITAKLLREADRIIRITVKKILHLNISCHNSIFYAQLKKGGQGLFCFRDSIPTIMQSRWTRLSNRDPILDEALRLSTTWFTRIKSLIRHGQETRVQVHNHHTMALEKSYSGNGTSQMEGHSACNDYIVNPPVYWSGEEYIRAMQLRQNLLPTKGIPSNPISVLRLYF